MSSATSGTMGQRSKVVALTLSVCVCVSSTSFMSDFDIMLAKKKAMSSKKRRHRDGGTFISDADDVVSAMITKMTEAAEVGTLPPPAPLPPEHCTLPPHSEADCLPRPLHRRTGR